MLRLRTRILLCSIMVFGVGIGGLSSLSDGLYSAICLFLLPLLVALAGASIIADFNQTTEAAKPAARKATARSHNNFDLPHAA